MTRRAFCILHSAFCIFLALTFAPPARPAIIDRIAAVVENEVITLSEVEQFVTLGVIRRQAGEDDTEYRRRVLDAMIAQALRYRDVERFGAEDVPRDMVASRLNDIVARFPSEEAFTRALAETELTLEELHALLKRQLQVEAYIDERFAPLWFVSLEEIERYYTETWLQQRRDRGLPVVPLSVAREEIRTMLKAERVQAEIEEWTARLRASANVDVYVFR
jgi:peptidyl-prolyl cis-trans isomerase SurA